MQFSGKVVVITGAAKGIGKSITEKFAALGARTVILDFDEISGKNLECSLSKNGHETLFIKTDVSNFDSLVRVRKAVIDHFGRVDVLVLNAGISYKHSLSEICVEEWDRVIKTNLSGNFYAIKAFYDDFKAKQASDEGKIIFITSGSAITGTGGGAHYASSKAGQHGLMRTISKEFGANGVNVNAIAPRVIETDILNQLYPTEESKDDLKKEIPIGRLGQPEDIANLTVFLASRESSYIHGQIVLIDGGRTYS
jgi:3-oxoacyl-[acyl-carrier protein] reductase